MNPIARTRISMLRLEQVMGMSIKAGAHTSLEEGACVMESSGYSLAPSIWSTG
jgi:hypothetical protein